MPQGLTPDPLELPFIELQSVDSTNNYARQLIHENMAAHGTIIFTHEQVAGKGQQGRSWLAEKDQNVLMSMVLKPLPLHLSQQFQLSACIAVAVHDLFAKYAGDDTKIKWPNDIYWQDRKAAGVLIESGVGSQESGVASQEPGHWKWAIIGVGVNVNQTIFDPELPNPVSLKQITGKDFDPIQLAKELGKLIENNFQQLITNGFDEFYDRYDQSLYKKDKKVRLKKDNIIFEGTIKEVSREGKLIVQHAIEEEFDFGKVELVP